MGRFILKHIMKTKPQMQIKKKVAEENNINENKSVMTTDEKVAMAQEVMAGQNHNTKRLKKDKGLIERTESSKTILTEDNKELLND